MSFFQSTDHSQCHPLQRYSLLRLCSQAGGLQLPEKEATLHTANMLAAESKNNAASCNKLIGDLQIKLKNLQIPDSRREKLISTARATIGRENAKFSSSKQSKGLLDCMAESNPAIDELQETASNVLQSSKQVMDAERAKQQAASLLSSNMLSINQVNGETARITPGWSKSPDATEGPPARGSSHGPPTGRRVSDNPLLKKNKPQQRYQEEEREQGGEPPGRKRRLEDADTDSRPTRKWTELNLSRPPVNSSADLGHEPDARGNPKKNAWNSLGRNAGPLADVSNNEGHADERAPSEEDDIHAAPGFQTARAKLMSDMKKKGQTFSGFGGQNNSGHQPGMAPRTGLARRPRGGLGGKGGAAGASNVRNGFVPPFVQKAMDGPGEENEGPYSERVMNLLAGPDGELPEEITKLDPKLIELVCNEIVDSSGGVKWEDIAGQDHAKRLVQELVVWPILNPHLFKGARAPPRGLLLFGPPGTGKTLIGKAIASNMEATFFSISASSLTSKWIGEGEKMVRALFAVAGSLQPSVIFIDEIDSVLSARKSEGEHEASRRLKTEMLIQMEGCDPNSASRRLLIIGATNRPEELDEAARRRLPKQLYIPLPCGAARRHMILRQLGPDGSVRASLSDTDLDKLVAKTDGYSGSDMRNLIQEACQGPVRDAVQKHGSALAQLSEDDLRAVNIKDFQMAAKVQKASVAPAEVERYEQYNEVHGARYVDAGEGNNGADDDDDW